MAVLDSDKLSVALRQAVHNLSAKHLGNAEDDVLARKVINTASQLVDEMLKSYKQ